MASSKEYLNFILEQTAKLNLTHRSMMKEYLLYKDDVYFGGIFDDRLLVKITKSVEKYAMSEQLPYEGAKPMYLVDCVDEQDKLCAIISEVTEDLKKNPKKKK